MAFAQPRISIGAKGGFFFDSTTPAGDTRRTSTQDESRAYTVGGAVEARLTDRWSLGVDALYKRLGSTTETTDLLGGYSIARIRSNVWEFPMYGRYSFRPWDAKLRPFAAGGYSIRARPIQGDLWGYVRDLPGNVINSYTRKIDDDTEIDHGIHMGGGVVCRLGERLRLTAEYRYTNWLRSDARYLDRQHQHEILLTFGF